MEIIPAIDVRAGRCVRLFQGDYDKETVFSDDPVAMAKRWQAEGAPRLHVVDLDGARGGQQANAEAMRRILSSVDVPVEVAGGIRNIQTVDRWIAANADRVVIGTAAVEDPTFAAEACERYGDRIVVSIDARGGYFAAAGWRDQTEERADDLIRRFTELGVQRFVYTDIDVDGTLTEPNYSSIEALLKMTPAKLIAAGGIAKVEHIIHLAELGVEGAIVGRALYEGTLSLPDALAALAETRAH